MIPATFSTSGLLRQGFGGAHAGGVRERQPKAVEAPKAQAVALTTPVTPDTGPALEPKAIEILKAASGRLAAAHSMTFTAAVTYESPTRQGPPLVYATQSDVTLVRPNKLRVITPGDGPASEFYYDGKIMMAYAPAEDLVAVADARFTVDATLETAPLQRRASTFRSRT